MKKSISTIVTLGILLTAMFACSETNNVSKQAVFINGDFEYKTNPTTPAKWIVELGEFSLDSTIKFSGNYSGRFTRDSSHQKIPYGVVYGLSTVRLLANKTIEMRAKVRYELKDTASSAMIFLQHFPNTKIVSLGKEFKGSGDWVDAKATIEIDSLPPIALAVGGLIAGEGTMWLDEVELYANGELISYSPRKTPLNSNEKTWLNENTFDIQGDALYSSIGDSKIVGIGEESHGSANIQSTRWEIVKDLIKNKDFTILALEMYQYADLDDLNAYITLQTDFLPAMRSYNFNFIQWLRKHNETAKKKVQCRGVESKPACLIDVINRDSKGALALQIDTLKQIMLPAMVEQFKAVDSAFKTIEFTTEEQNTFIRVINRCKQWAEVNLIDEKRKDEFIYITNLLKDNLEFSNGKRDEMMANIIEHLLIEHPDDKILFIAHNGHVQFGLYNRGHKTTGSYLRDKFGKEYYPIRMTFYDGEYRTRKRAVSNGSIDFDAEFATFSLPAMQGSSEYLFNCIDKELFYLPLRGVKPMNGYNDWLFQPLEHRSIGAVEQPYIYDTYRLTDGFDAVIFIKTSTVYNR